MKSFRGHAGRVNANFRLSQNSNSRKNVIQGNQKVLGFLKFQT
jgi:hypothetical protein